MANYFKTCSCGMSYEGYSACPNCTADGVAEVIEELQHARKVKQEEIRVLDRNIGWYRNKLIDLIDKD